MADAGSGCSSDWFGPPDVVVDDPPTPWIFIDDDVVNDRSPTLIFKLDTTIRFR
jgi:hypothetical protein